MLIVPFGLSFQWTVAPELSNDAFRSTVPLMSWYSRLTARTSS
ncbi:Uncharacterised protein [Mycobacteroides abscessus subsp. abscessus]|nr:Uncharacterised protein [Mycobacteroides abscessus subsp. abscessus]